MSSGSICVGRKGLVGAEDEEEQAKTAEPDEEAASLFFRLLFFLRSRLGLRLAESSEQELDEK